MSEVETVLALRTCNSDLTSYGGFKWPSSGMVEAPDWNPEPVCGGGLHGLLFGEGSADYLAHNDPEAKWLVCALSADSVVDIGGKIKFPRCEVVHCGDRLSATTYLIENGGRGRSVACSTLTGGYGATLTGGYGATLTGGNRSTLTGGDDSTLTGGDDSTLTGGYGSTIAVRRWNGKRYKFHVAEVKTIDGEGELEAGIQYRLDASGLFVKAEGRA